MRERPKPGLDVAKLRKLVADPRQWNSKGKVLEVEEDDDEGTIDVKVRLMPTDIVVWAQLVTPYGGAGYGDWSLPDVGEMVWCSGSPQAAGDLAWVVLGNVSSKSKKKPSGSVDGKRKITMKPGDDLEVESADGGSVKFQIDGSSAVLHVTLTGGALMLVDDGTGAVALALKSDVDNLRTFVIAHVHTVPGVGGTSPPTTTPVAVVGTTRLKAE